MKSADRIAALKQQAASALVPLVERGYRDDAADILGTERQRIADLRRGRLDRFSLERLILFLLRAGAHVKLRITPPRMAGFARHDDSAAPGRSAD